MFTEYEKIAIERGYKVLMDGTCLNSRGKSVGSNETSKTNPYPFICIRLDGKKINIQIHRIQAYQKFGEEIYKEGIQVRHLDGNHRNNSFDNIEIGFQSSNMMDIPKEKRNKKSSEAHKIYSDEIVQEIKDFHKLGHSYLEIMNKFDISSKGTVSYIINKR